MCTIPTDMVCLFFALLFPQEISVPSLPFVSPEDLLIIQNLISSKRKDWRNISTAGCNITTNLLNISCIPIAKIAFSYLFFGYRKVETGGDFNNNLIENIP